MTAYPPKNRMSGPRTSPLFLQLTLLPFWPLVHIENVDRSGRLSKLDLAETSLPLGVTRRTQTWFWTIGPYQFSRTLDYLDTSTLARSTREAHGRAEMSNSEGEGEGSV